LRRALPRALAALIPVAMAACASSGGSADAADAPSTSSTVTLTRAGEAVQLTENAESTHECEFVAHLPLSSTRVSDVNALRMLRNEAGRSGANLVLLVMESRTRIARAEGYLCAD
jgi:hypothetical protein